MAIKGATAGAVIQGKIFRIPALVHRDGRVYVDAELPEDGAGDEFGVVEMVNRIPDEMRSVDTAEIRIEMEMDIEMLFVTRLMSAKLKPQTITQVLKQYQDMYRELHGRTPEYRMSGKSWIYVEGMGENGKPVRRREIEGRIAQMRNEIAMRRSGKSE